MADDIGSSEPDMDPCPTTSKKKKKGGKVVKAHGKKTKHRLDKRARGGETGEKWMQKAVPASHRGIFTKKAEHAGKSVHEYVEEKKHAPGKLGKEARFALIATKIAKKND